MRVLPLVKRLRVRPPHQARVLAPGWDWRRRRAAPAAEYAEPVVGRQQGISFDILRCEASPSSNQTLLDSAIRRRCPYTRNSCIFSQELYSECTAEYSKPKGEAAMWREFDDAARNLRIVSSCVVGGPSQAAEIRARQRVVTCRWKRAEACFLP